MTLNRTGFVRRMGAIMNRAMNSVNYRLHVASANLWRDSYNPLRSLTIMRAVNLLEDGERGAMADLQWTYRYIEMQDATLGALVERRTSAIQELDWDIKTRAEIPAGKAMVAKRQQAALKQAYDRIGNLSAAFETLAMASFRGFSRLEKVTDENGDIVELASVDQWFWVRRGLYGAWKLNRDSRIGSVDGEDVPEPRFISREVSRPINRVALVAFVRKALSQKDWDGFIETYGIPAVFIVMPDNVPEDKSEEYLEMADQVTGDARGVLPGGSEVKTVDNGARGNNPFKDHIAYQDEQVVLRGTGGKLTMLAESGSGTLGGSVHAETFAAIARAEAAEISEILRKCIDAEIIERVTPGEDAYAYFELAANEETDPGEVVKGIVELESAGLEVDAKWIEEKTGYPVVRRKTEDLKTEEKTGEPLKILNRKGAEDAKGAQRKIGADDFDALFRSTLAEAVGVRSEVLAPLDDLIGGLTLDEQEGGMDDATWLQFVESAAESFPELFDPADAAALAADLEAAMGTAVLIGTRDALREEKSNRKGAKAAEETQRKI